MYGLLRLNGSVAGSFHVSCLHLVIEVGKELGASWWAVAKTASYRRYHHACVNASVCMKTKKTTLVDERIRILLTKDADE